MLCKENRPCLYVDLLGLLSGSPTVILSYVSSCKFVTGQTVICMDPSVSLCQISKVTSGRSLVV